jgi:hypothetical protein
MKERTKLLALFVALIMAFGLAACDPNEDDKNQPPNPFKDTTWEWTHEQQANVWDRIIIEFYNDRNYRYTIQGRDGSYTYSESRDYYYTFDGNTATLGGHNAKATISGNKLTLIRSEGLETWETEFTRK